MIFSWNFLEWILFCVLNLPWLMYEPRLIIITHGALFLENWMEKCILKYITVNICECPVYFLSALVIKQQQQQKAIVSLCEINSAFSNNTYHHKNQHQEGMNLRGRIFLPMFSIFLVFFRSMFFTHLTFIEGSLYAEHYVTLIYIVR